MSAKISQKDYLKKYLSSDKSTDKKKKKKKSKTLIGQSVKIIDDDIDFSKLHQIADEDLEVYAIGEDAPQIVGVFDERPPELIAKEDYKNNGKWKVIADDDGFTSSLNIQFTDSDGKVSKSAKNDFRKKSRDNADDDLSPPRIQVRINENNSSYNSLQKNSKIHKRVEEPKSSRFTDASPQRRSKCGSDESPPRRNAPVDNKTSTSNLAPRRHRRNSIDDSSTFRKHSDSSPKIKIKQEPDSDVSPPRRRRSPKNSDSDQSPPRILKNYSSSTLGKKVKVERDSLCSSVRPRYSENRGYTHLDKSPPRKFRGRSSSGPLGRQIKQEYDSDVPSVSRKRSRSPSRRGYAGSGSSKPRMDRRFSKSPSNHRRRSPYKHRDNRSPSVERRVRSSSIEGNNQNIRKTLDLKTAGLQNAKALRIENEKSKQREEEVFKKMSTDMSGRNAEAVVRDRKTGRIRDLGEEAAREHEKLMKEQEKKAVYDKWGKGLKQVEDYRSRLQNDLLEINKPLARYSDDKDLEEMLKKQERDGDPMLNYIRNKVESRSDATPSKPIYRGAYPENRFGIRPGYRWDGVDRSNGYETKWFDMQSKQKAGEEEAYKYSTEDM